MVESALTSAAVVILNRLIPEATKQISLAWGFEKELEELHKRLTNIQALVRDAERKRVESELLKIWLKNLNTGACRAENVLDKLAYEALRRKIEVQNPLMDKLSISFCPELRCLPKGLLQPSLARLEIRYCPSLGCDELHNLTSLKELSIAGCPRWESLWEKGLLCSTSLQKLVIGGFSSQLSYFPWPCTRAHATSDMDTNYHPPQQQCPFISLNSVSLHGWAELKCLPNLGHLTALKELEIISFDGLEALPEWLGILSSLQSLTLLWCQELRSLPSREAIQCLANLQYLLIYKCPLLETRCKKGSGEEWHKIAHIPVIEINGGLDERYVYRN